MLGNGYVTRIGEDGSEVVQRLIEAKKHLRHVESVSLKEVWFGQKFVRIKAPGFVGHFCARSNSALPKTPMV